MLNLNKLFNLVMIEIVIIAYVAVTGLSVKGENFVPMYIYEIIAKTRKMDVVVRT